MSLLPMIKRDYQVYCRHLEIEKYWSVKRWCYLFARSTFAVVLLFRLSSSRSLVLRPLAAALYKAARTISGIQIPRGTRIGGGLLLPHYGTIVINRRSQVGEDCIILHNVTIGVKGISTDTGVPVVGDRVYIGAGGVILGSVKIGNDSVVGAGALVLKDLPQGHVALGNPAKFRPLARCAAVQAEER